jgi:hypothetical protein
MLGLLLVVSACHTGALSSAIPTEPSEPQPTATSEATPTGPIDTHLCGSTDEFLDYLPYTTASLAERGWDFVLADVIGFEPAFFNTVDGKAPIGFPNPPSSLSPNPKADTLIYTPMDVNIVTVISGPWTPGTTEFLIEGGTVPIEGGEVDCFTMRVDDVPHVQPKSRYVLVLSEALYADGEKALPFSKARFAWPVDANGTVMTHDGPMSIDDLTRVVSEVTPSSSPK